MSWILRWSPQAQQDLLYNVAYGDAGAVDAAVTLLVETQEGDLRRVEDDESVAWRLYVPPHYCVLLVFDRFDGVVHVLGVFRAPKP